MATWRLRVDLHTHTSYSDGLDSPTQLVAKAAQQGLHSMVITDHDTWQHCQKHSKLASTVELGYW